MSISLDPFDYASQPVVDGTLVLLFYSVYEWMGYEDFVAGMFCLLLVTILHIARNNQEGGDE